MYNNLSLSLYLSLSIYIYIYTNNYNDNITTHYFKTNYDDYYQANNMIEQHNLILGRRATRGAATSSCTSFIILLSCIYIYIYITIPYYVIVYYMNR